MAISQAITVSFKQDLMSPGGNLEAQTLKGALYDNTATLGKTLLLILLQMKYLAVVQTTLLAVLH